MRTSSIRPSQPLLDGSSKWMKPLSVLITSDLIHSAAVKAFSPSRAPANSSLTTYALRPSNCNPRVVLPWGQVAAWIAPLKPPTAS